MVAQRGAGVSAPPTLSAPAAYKDKPKTATVQAQRAKPRLSSRERQVLDKLPARIEELRALKARLQSLLNDTEFYARNPAKFAEVSAAFAKAGAALAEAEGEWLRLAILREESSGESSAKKLRAEPT